MLRSLPFALILVALALPSGGTHHEQVRHIYNCYQQHQSHTGQQHQERRAYIPDHVVAKRLNLGRPICIHLRPLFFKLRRDSFHFRVALFDCDSRSQLSEHLRIPAPGFAMSWSDDEWHPHRSHVDEDHHGSLGQCAARLRDAVVPPGCFQHGLERGARRLLVQQRDTICVAHHARQFGQSKYGFSRTFRVFLDLFTLSFLLSFQGKPMRLFGAAGLVTGAIGVLILAYLAFIKIFEGALLSNRPILWLGVMLVILGVQFIFFGLLAEMQARTYYESQDKSIYVVREVFPRSPSPSPDEEAPGQRVRGGEV